MIFRLHPLLFLPLLLGLTACTTPPPGDGPASFAAQLEQAKPQWRERFEAAFVKDGAQWTPEAKEAQWQKYWAEVVRRAEKDRDEMLKRHSDINLVGTVVDQFGQPVANAVVTVEARRAAGSGYLLGFTSRNEMLHGKTDKTGHFVIGANRAIRLSLEDIEAPGCQFYKDTQAAWYFFSTPEASRSDPVDWNLRKKGPVTFVLWRLVGEPERLYLGETRFDRRSALPARQGFRFAESFVPADKIEADGKNVDLLIDMLPNPKDTSGKSNLLRVTAPPGGGVVPGNWYEFFAPADDRYGASAEFEVRENATPCIFLKARDARGYAKIRFTVRIRDDEKTMGVRLNYYLNPWGSRNLQLGNQEKVYPDELAVILRKQAEKQGQDAKPAVPAVPGGKALPPAPAPGP